MASDRDKRRPGSLGDHHGNPGDRRDIRETKAAPPGLIERSSADRLTPRPATPVFVEEEITGKYEGEELMMMRSRRPTYDRLGRLEKKNDEMTTAMNTIAVSHGVMSGKLDTLVDLAGAAAAAREKQAATEAEEREKKRKYIVPVITAVGVIIVGLAAALLGTR